MPYLYFQVPISNFYTPKCIQGIATDNKNDQMYAFIRSLQKMRDDTVCYVMSCISKVTMHTCPFLITLLLLLDKLTCTYPLYVSAPWAVRAWRSKCSVWHGYSNNLDRYSMYSQLNLAIIDGKGGERHGLSTRQLELSIRALYFCVLIDAMTSLPAWTLQGLVLCDGDWRELKGIERD